LNGTSGKIFGDYKHYLQKFGISRGRRRRRRFC
jgi:hypothetical protein